MPPSNIIVYTEYLHVVVCQSYTLDSDKPGNYHTLIRGGIIIIMIAHLRVTHVKPKNS